MNQNKLLTFLKNLLKKFRNYLQIARVLIVRRAIYEAFITLQKKSKNDEKSNQKKIKLIRSKNKSKIRESILFM
jgi:hypothetical protein